MLDDQFLNLQVKFELKFRPILFYFFNVIYVIKSIWPFHKHGSAKCSTEWPGMVARHSGEACVRLNCRKMSLCRTNWTIVLIRCNDFVLFAPCGEIASFKYRSLSSRPCLAKSNILANFNSFLDV